MLTLGILSTFMWAIPFFILVSPPVTPPVPLPVVTPPVTPTPVTPTPITPTPVTPPAAKKAKDIPELADLVARGQVNGELLWNPFDKLLFRPDGSPFTIAWAAATLEVEPMAQAAYMLDDYFPRMGLGPEGGKWVTFDAALDIDAQIAWMEDMVATWKPDLIMIHSANAELLAPAAEKAVAAGIPVFTLDMGIDSPTVTSFIAHKFEGPGGTDVLAEWLVKDLQRRGYGADNPVVVGELWGIRGMKTAQLRSDGFHKVIDRYPWITVIQTEDTNWNNEVTKAITANLIMDHPEVKALFHHGCGGTGMFNGLESNGKLLPLDDPNHIIVVSNDCEIVMWDQVINGWADAFSTHGGVEPTDICLQVAITNVILGQPVEKFYQCPYIMVDKSNIDTVQIGGVPPYPGWPRGRWDTWLPADPFPDYGFPQPSLALRKQYMGY